ncbi:hypothetical protein G9A89_022432 [Geosiphon pyriformis]|nr:hypothetical protein G9A89_022432 [Geosiphon pyriformis]
MKSLFQHYSFNFYVNKKISSLLGTPVNTKSARETFYRELIQNTNLPTNHNFASIITKINKEIEHHTQQRYPITYASKDKRKLQIPVVTPKKIQPPTWKKTRVKSPTAPSYYYTLGSTINITSASVFTSNMISTFRQFPFQSKQKKTDLLRPYDPMAYTPITKLDNFTSEDDNVQVWLNDVEKAITANRWNDARAL